MALAALYLDELDQVGAVAEDVAGITHAHLLGRAGAVAHATAVALALRSKPAIDPQAIVIEMTRQPVVSRSGLGERLGAVLELVVAKAEIERAARVLGTGVLAEEAVPFALFAFLRWAPDFEAVVRHAILGGGDTDTIAAMAGALCGAIVGAG